MCMKLKCSIILTMAFIACGQFFIVVASCLAVSAAPSHQKNATCMVGGRGYQAGENIGDPCDGCVCTQYGTMCQLRYCPPAPCVVKVRPPGECCDTCPTGPTCEYVGEYGTSIIPEDGCRYSDTFVCYCYGDRSGHIMRPICLPPLSGDSKVPCNVTTPDEA